MAVGVWQVEEWPLRHCDSAVVCNASSPCSGGLRLGVIRKFHMFHNQDVQHLHTGMSTQSTVLHAEALPTPA